MLYLEIGLTMKKKINRQKGVGLIEVLVTVLLLATGLLVMAALQIRSLQFNQSAYMRSQANILAYDIIDRIRLNRANAASYDITLDAATPTGTTLAQVDINQWRTNIAATVPNGTGSIDCNTGGICTIQIRWAELNSSSETTEDTSIFTYSTQI